MVEVKQMTAVEWLIDKLSNIKAEDFNSTLEVRLICQQAKAMHKQQIIDAYDKNKMGRVDYGEQYYQETYGK
jgi:hypothetical protein